MLICFSPLSQLKSLHAIEDRLTETEDKALDWAAIHGLIKVLSYPEQLTKKLQTEQYIVGDFVWDYEKCIFKLEHLVSKGAPYRPDKLLKEFANVKSKVFDKMNSIFHRRIGISCCKYIINLIFFNLYSNFCYQQ